MRPWVLQQDRNQVGTVEVAEWWTQRNGLRRRRLASRYGQRTTGVEPEGELEGGGKPRLQVVAEELLLVLRLLRVPVVLVLRPDDELVHERVCEALDLDEGPGVRPAADGDLRAVRGRVPSEQ